MSGFFPGTEKLNHHKDAKISHLECENTELNTIFVYTKVGMKNITFSADEDMIQQARLVARSQRRTLNEAFREWLAQFAGLSQGAREAEAIMKRLRHVKSQGPYTREEMNER